MKIRNNDEDQSASLSSVTNAVIKRAMNNSDDEKALDFRIKAQFFAHGQFQRRVDETTEKSIANPTKVPTENPNANPTEEPTANPTKVPTAGGCEQDEAHVQDSRATKCHSECDAPSHEACEITDRMVTGSEEKEDVGVKIDGSHDTKVSDKYTFRALLRLRKSISVRGPWLKVGAICVMSLMLGRVDAQSDTWVGYGGATFGSEPILEACKRKFADITSVEYYEDGCTFYHQGLNCDSGGSNCFLVSGQYGCCDLQQCQDACVSFS